MFFTSKIKNKQNSKSASTIKRRVSAKRERYLRYRETARVLVHDRLEYYKNIYSSHGHMLTYKRVTIRDQKSRWGSCSTKGNLNFNYRLVLLPMHLVDYVIVHELSHLIHMNHSREFWDTVALGCRDYSKCRLELHKINIKYDTKF